MHVKLLRSFNNTKVSTINFFYRAQFSIQKLRNYDLTFRTNLDISVHCAVLRVGVWLVGKKMLIYELDLAEFFKQILFDPFFTARFKEV